MAVSDNLKLKVLIISNKISLLGSDPGRLECDSVFLYVCKTVENLQHNAGCAHFAPMHLLVRILWFLKAWQLTKIDFKTERNA